MRCDSSWSRCGVIVLIPRWSCMQSCVGPMWIADVGLTMWMWTINLVHKLAQHINVIWVKSPTGRSTLDHFQVVDTTFGVGAPYYGWAFHKGTNQSYICHFLVQGLRSYITGTLRPPRRLMCTGRNISLEEAMARLEAVAVFRMWMSNDRL